jgi:hypothetical protein
VVMSWTLHDGEVVTEAELLCRAADAVDTGLRPVDAVLRVWQGPRPVAGGFGATQLIRGCTPWLASLVAADTDVAAAMRARAAFLEDPEAPCPACGHHNGRHDGSPCLPSRSLIPCLDCRYARTADPAVDDPDCE